MNRQNDKWNAFEEPNAMVQMNMESDSQNHQREDNNFESLRDPFASSEKPNSALIQEFSDFAFLFVQYPEQQIRIQQAIDDLTRYLDHFLNNNIKTIISFAKIITSGQQYQTLLQILRLILKRRFHISKEIIVLIKHCFLIRRLIEISRRFPSTVRLAFCTTLLSFDENHFNSPYTHSQITSELQLVHGEMVKKIGSTDQKSNFYFITKGILDNDSNPLAAIYVDDLLRTDILSVAREQIPSSLGFVITLLQFSSQREVKKLIPQSFVINKIHESLGTVTNLSKNQIELTMKHCSLYCQDADTEDKSSLLELQLQMASQLFQSSSIEKKIWSMGIVNEKIKLLKMVNKDMPIDSQELLYWLDSNRFYDGIIQPNVHSEIINRSNQLLRFLYENSKIGVVELQQIINLALKSECDSITAFVHNFVMFLEHKDLQTTFDYLVKKVGVENNMSYTSIVLFQSVVNSHKLTAEGRQNKKRRSHSGAKKNQERKRSKSSKAEVDLFDDKKRKQSKMLENEELVISEPTELSLKIFKYISIHVDEYPLIPALIKLINNEPAIFNEIPQFLVNSIRDNRPSSIPLLDSIIKISFPIPKDKRLWTRYELISWLAGQGIFEYLIAGVALNRIEKSATQRLSILILLARYYNKPFETSQIQQLWKILGLRAVDQKQREQFFVFIRDCLTKSNNMLFTQESIHYIYFEILLRLHSAWFTMKVYECLQMFFLRLNQDCKLITHPNISTYQLVDTQLIGVKKFWYIYLRGEDTRVTKKCRQFLCRLISKFQYNDKVAEVIKDKYVNIIVSGIQSSVNTIKSGKSDTKPEFTQIARCLDMLIKLLDDLDGMDISGDKVQEGQEWTMNIINNITDSLPPKKFTMKVGANSSLRVLRESIATKLNPPKKESQIKLMTRGHYPKGENLSLKQLKFINKQTFMVQNNQQMVLQGEPISNEGSLQMLKMMFPNHSDELIKYVLVKRLGEDQQAIAQVLLDDQAVSNYMKEIEEAKAPCRHLSQLLVSNIHIFQVLFQVLALQSQEMSILVWKIISNLPSSTHHINMIRDTILKTHDWNQVFSFSSTSLFKTLYNLQLLRNMLIGGANECINKDEQVELTNRFVETGGFEHICKAMRVLMTSWKGDVHQAKLLSYIIQVYKIYLKPHLAQEVKQPLSFMFKEVSNYRRHLMELGNNQIRHIITEIVSPEQTNTITSKSWKSFSFKGQSNSSNPTPGFRSPNESGRNSPHSQTPKHNKQQDNISLVSVSKSINTSNSRKKRSLIQLSFQNRMRQNINLQLCLQQIVNPNELVQMILRNLRVIIESPHLLENEDISLFSDEIFEIFFPILLIGTSYQQVFNDTAMVEIIGRGMAEAVREDFRVKLVYLVFLLCVIEEEDKLIVQNDDQLFMTEEPKRLKPRIFFMKTLLPLFKSGTTLRQEYFLCFSKLIREINHQDLEEFIDPRTFVDSIVKQINDRPFVQTLDNENQDYTLNGLLLLLQTLMEKYKSLKSECSSLVSELLQYLFFLPSSAEISLTDYPKCKRNTTRRSCFKLLLELCKQCQPNATNLDEKLSEYCKNLHSKQYYDSVVIKNQKYSGLKNLGATCYINSLLQQFHKNTPLEQLLSNSDLVHIDGQHPLHELAYLFTSLSTSLMNTVNPLNFVKTVRFHGVEDINIKIQQDVNQFFMAFVDLLERNQAKPILQASLMGQICNEITCCEQDQNLKFLKMGTQNFYTVTLDIKGKKSLVEALQYFVKGDLLDGDNKYYSEELGRKVKVIKRSYLKTLPNTLVFTLKRFEFDYNSMLRYKLNDYFEFPLELDLIKYTEQSLSDQIQNMHDESYFKYRLVGVLVHSGTAQSGHYYSYIKDQDKWYQFNDSSVTEFNINNLKTECFGGEDNKTNDFDSRNRNAYLLFYQRIVPFDNEYSVSLKSGVETKNADKVPSLYSQLVWKQNFKFLKSRLIYDNDFLKFLGEVNSQVTNNLVNNIRGKEESKKCFIDFTSEQLNIANPDINMAIQDDIKYNDDDINDIKLIRQEESRRLLDQQDSEDFNLLAMF